MAKRFIKEIQFIKSLFPGQDFIPLHAPVFNGNEKKYMNDCIDTTFVSSVGKYVDGFEEKIRDYTGSKYAVATVNGTAALHMALILAGVKPGDVVITQSLTFIATCNAISYCGAEPVFVDVDMTSMGMSPDSLKQFLKDDAIFRDGYSVLKSTNKRIAACVPMHTFGHPCRIEEIKEICLSYNVPLVEDAAESIGSFHDGKHTGTAGRLGTFSFNGNKTITCGGGGMIITDDDKLGQLAKHLTTQAKKPHKWEFNHDYIGYNYRMPNVNAALGVAQMEQLHIYLASKRQLAEEYQAYFNLSEIVFMPEPEHTISNYWLNCIMLPNLEERDMFLKETNESGVMTRPTWNPMHELTMFQRCLTGDLSNTRTLADRIVNIPSSVRINI